MLLTQVSPRKVTNNLTNFELNFSNTKRDEKIDFSKITTNYLLNTNGAIYEIRERTNENSSLTVVGGDSRFLYQKDLDEEPEEYITPVQIKKIREMMKHLSYTGGISAIESDSDFLYRIAYHYYFNFKG